MVEVKMNKEINEIEENVFFGLGLKKVVILGIGILLNLILYFRLEPVYGLDIAGFVIIITIIPFIFLAFYNKDGMDAFRFIRQFVRYRFLMPAHLFFKSRPVWKDIGVPPRKERKDGSKESNG